MTIRDPLPRVTAVRTAKDLYTIRNDQGAELRVAGPGTEGAFTPGELLQAALAGCSALSADAQLASKLGPDFEATATVDATRHEDDNRVEKLLVTLATDMSSLSAEDRDKLLVRTDRIVERLCAIKRSLNAGVESAVTVQGEPPAE